MRTRFRRRVGTPGPSPGSPRQTPGFHLARGSRPRGPEWREAAGALRGSAARGQRQAACVRSLVCGELGGGACSSPEARGRLSSFPPQGTSFLVPAPLCFLEPRFPPPNQKLAPLGVPRFCCGISFGAGWGRWGSEERKPLVLAGLCVTLRVPIVGAEEELFTEQVERQAPEPSALSIISGKPGDNG